VLQAQLKGLVSDEHFSVDGTLFEAWASHKSFRRKGRRRQRQRRLHGERRRNDTHESTTDPDARLARKGAGKEAKLSYQASTLMENRNGLIVAVDVRQASGTAEREAALDLIDEMLLGEGCTVGADKGNDTAAFIEALTKRRIVPHVAQSTAGRRSAVPDRVARTKGYAASQEIRKRIEQGFGWTKTIGGLRKLMRVCNAFAHGRHGRSLLTT